MILYFDNLITNIPMVPGIYTDLDRIRDSCKSYSTKDRYEITLYELASYAELDWDEVVIVYEFGEDIIHRKKEFEIFVRNLWPGAHIFYGRSDNQKKFQKHVKFLNKFQDEWIFYAGNNDHPFIAPNKETLNSCLDEAKKLRKKWEYVSIAYSHFSEHYKMGDKKSIFRKYMSLPPKILGESEYSFTLLFNEVWGHSVQIFNKNLLNHLVFSEDLGDEKFKKIDLIWIHDKMRFKRLDHIVIVPKNPICEHFDGYSHLKRGEFPLSEDIFPPLFIPKGFFEEKIKIRYGYNDYKDGWVNINPLNDKYIFQNSNGTDLKISLEDIPLFWEKRIQKIDVNPNLNQEDMSKKIKEIHKRMRYPHELIEDRSLMYKLKIKIISANYLPYWMVRWMRSNKIISNIRLKVLYKIRKKFSVNTSFSNNAKK